MGVVVTMPSNAEALEALRPRRIELTILMPCLNEAETVAIRLREAQGFLQRMGVAGEFLVDDGGSRDGSDELSQPGAHLLCG